MFHAGGRALPADSLARTLTVRPESASILYVGDSFRVRETLCVPVDEAGAVILLEVETEQPLEIEAVFTPDFQLEWPAALGGTYVNWDDKQHALVFGEETHKFAALVGSPTGADPHLAYQTNYSSSEENSLRLGVTQKGKETKELVIAAVGRGLGRTRLRTTSGCWQRSQMLIRAIWRVLPRISRQDGQSGIARCAPCSRPTIGRASARSRAW